MEYQMTVQINIQFMILMKITLNSYLYITKILIIYVCI